MKTFRCSRCHQQLFFENVECTRCGATLAYLPDVGVMSGLEFLGSGAWRAMAPVARGARYRLCTNYAEHGTCNWAVPEVEPATLCRSCRLDQVIPNLGDPFTKEAWYRLEQAKRRVVVTLLGLGLPLLGKAEDPVRGLAFAFLADEPGRTIVTGHAEGVVTINVAEAHAPFRERLRVELGETHRTLLGHVRHEIGHYYWDRLVRENPPCLAGFRIVFGDEKADYEAARRWHYERGPAPRWADRYVSAYASMHPWEDWAETWALYLLLVDTLETAQEWGLSFAPTEEGTAGAEPRRLARCPEVRAFEDLIERWLPLVGALNSLNRSMGLPDCFPLVLSSVARDKLSFVHDVIEASRVRPA